MIVYFYADSSEFLKVNDQKYDLDANGDVDKQDEMKHTAKSLLYETR